MGRRTITTTASDLEIRQACLSAAARQFRMAAIGHIVVASLVVLVLWSRGASVYLTAWLALMVAAGFARIQLGVRVRLAGDAAPERVVGQLTRKTIAISAVSGGLWGAIGAGVFIFGSDGQQTFIACIINAMSAAAVASSGAIAPAGRLFVLLAVSSLAFGFGWRGEGWSDAVLAGLYVFYVGGLLQFLNGGHAALVAAIVAVKEKETATARVKVVEEASRLKSEFLSTMGHELRTPLNAIIGFSDLLRQGFGGSVTPEQQEYLDDIHMSGQHLLTLVNQILDLANIESGRMRAAVAPVNLGAIVADCCRLSAQQAQDANVTMIRSDTVADCTVRADAAKTRQVLGNLLSNAIKFTPAGGKVTISLDSGQVTIADTGIGMTQDQLALALEPFRQVDSTLSRRYDGTGLGLPIAKTFMELMGGAFDIESALGAGTIVRLRFAGNSGGDAAELNRSVRH